MWNVYADCIWPKFNLINFNICNSNQMKNKKARKIHLYITYTTARDVKSVQTRVMNFKLQRRTEKYICLLYWWILTEVWLICVDEVELHVLMEK